MFFLLPACGEKSLSPDLIRGWRAVSFREPDEGAFPWAQTCRAAPSPDLLRCRSQIDLSPHAGRGEVARGAAGKRRKRIEAAE